jgi:hypothetical protein
MEQYATSFSQQETQAAYLKTRVTPLSRGLQATSYKKNILRTAEDTRDVFFSKNPVRTPNGSYDEHINDTNQTVVSSNRGSTGQLNLITHYGDAKIPIKLDRYARMGTHNSAGSCGGSAGGKSRKSKGTGNGLWGLGVRKNLNMEKINSNHNPGGLGSKRAVLKSNVIIETFGDGRPEILEEVGKDWIKSTKDKLGIMTNCEARAFRRAQKSFCAEVFHKGMNTGSKF